MIHFEQVHFGVTHFSMRHFGGVVPAVATWFPPLFTVHITNATPIIHRGWRSEPTQFGGFGDVQPGYYQQSIIIHANMQQPVVIQPMVDNRERFGGF